VTLSAATWPAGAAEAVWAIWRREGLPDAALEYYLIAEKDPKRIIAGFTDLVGEPRCR